MKKCNHNWVEINVEYYFNWFGDRIKKITYKCKECNKQKVNKYW